MSIQLQSPPSLADSPTVKVVEDQQNEPPLIPLSFAQQRLWLVDQLQPQSPLYNVPAALRLQGILNLTALRQSLQTIIERHEVLRTIYKLKGDAPIQEITGRNLTELRVVDLSKLSADEKDAELQRQLMEEARRPFDLSSDLMLRSILFRLHSEEHILFLNIHHIACDEWSMGVLFRELAALYQIFCEGKAVELREVPIQYADFALWQIERKESTTLARQLQYWRNQLSGELPVLELPTDRPRPVQTTHNGDCVKRLLPSGLSASLKKLCQTESVTPFMLLLAAFKTLLHRYTGQEDIIVGTPIAGRNRMELEELIGFFVNTLALRSRLSPDMRFRELLERVREGSLGAFSNQDLPFEKVVEELHPDRSAAHNPIFNVMFAVQNLPEEIRLSGLKVEPMEVTTRTAKFDLTLVFQETREGWAALLEYNHDLFDRATAERMLSNLENLLQGLAADPSQAIGQIPLLSAAETRRILTEWNATETDYPRHATVHQLFAAQAQRTPNEIAVIYGEEHFTFHQIDERSNQLSHYLRQHGVAPDVLVGICVERSIDMVIGWLGILKAGGAYVPLDPGYPEERLAFMLEDTKMPVLITQRKLASRLPKAAKKILLDADWKTISRENKTMPASGATSENLAYVIYTSGSTGKPKGAQVPHRAIARLLFNTNYIQLNASDRIAQASNSSFDAATFEVWGALLHGAKLIGVKQDILLSPRELETTLRENKISTLFLTTALFNQVAADAPQAFNTLKQVLFGGEACDPKSVRDILDHGGPERLLHVYGPTETTTFAAWFEVKSVPEGATTLPIGRPISNTTFFILDKNFQPVPIGVPGELFIGGDGLARGYHHRPELTAEKFVTKQFTFAPDHSKPNSTSHLTEEIKTDRLYRTGDLARYLPDGNVEFLGRIDNQVKIRGFRIELEEIEAALEQHEQVRDAVVLAREQNGSKRLVAYLVSQNKCPLAPEKLRQFLKAKLPDFMLPSAFVFLESFPINANGKIDRRALPIPENINASFHREVMLARNNLENQLSKIWESVLGVKPVGIRDNFFELGGHSLLAVRLFTRIESKMGLKLPLSTLFLAPTIEQLAQVISQKSWSAPGSSLVEIQPNGSRPPLFWLHTLGGGGGGGLFTYRKLAELLGDDQPSYGIVAPPEPFTRLEDMAAHYINEMRTIQPHGPYHLGGYCFGGIVAFEMARQLADKGIEVALLALIESLPSTCDQPIKLTGMIGQFFRNAPRWLSHLAAQPPEQILQRLQNKAASLRRKIKRVAYKNHPPNSSEDILAQLGEVIDFTNYPADFKRHAEIHWRALSQYRPKVFRGRITLFRTCKPHLLEPEPETVWSRLAEGVDVKLVPGTHEKILEDPYVQVLAKHLVERLRPTNVP